VELHFRNIDYVTPPGSLTDRLSHPYYGESSSVEVSLFHDHRYAFFFWNKWTQDLRKKDRKFAPPGLVTIDWHQDLMWPNETEKGWLDGLDLLNNRDVSLYAWANLTSINDGQIMAAAYLNLIGNIYIHCRQGRFDSHWEDEIFIDKYSNKHLIKKFKEYDDLERYLSMSTENKIYFDIDLDFFTLDNPLNGVGKNFTYLTNKQITEMLKPNRPLISWIFERMKGFTIAIEPEHTGGLLKSNKILGLIDSIYFKPGLFSNYAWQWNKQTNWKHLENK